MPLLLSDRLKSRLKVPYGTLYAGSGRKTMDLLKSAPDWGNPAKIISVGDVTTCNLIESGILPDICIVDHLTCRAEVSDEVKNCIQHPAYHEVTIKNPAGTITTDLVTAITDAMTCERLVRIFVQGEEDLAVIPAVALAPLSSIVIYGQPSSGCVLIKVTSEKKKEIRELLKQMEYANDGKSLWRML
ncbi:MAG: GTP-dependent dephospho-CoA kinase family protein [Candidatus Methanogasteraceae archaeon]